MAKLLNKDGTSGIDELTYDKNASGTVVYHTKEGNDSVIITGGSVSLVNDQGKDTIKITGGKMHQLTGVGSSVEEIIINGGAAVAGDLGAGKDVVTISNSDGRKTGGGASGIRGGSWNDTFTVNAGVKYYQLYGELGNDTFNVNGGSGINFWGGANNDTFIVKGGTSNKLYGGDSDDLFEIAAAKQNIILGYGKDTVNITAGDSQQIKGNLGINTINLLAGSGHIITADIDQAASKIVGADVGYGQDRVLIDGATQVTANLGDGRDTVDIRTGSGHNINTEGWTDTVTIAAGVTDSIINVGRGDDIINIQGGKDNTFIDGDGADTYNIAWDKLEGKITLAKDADTSVYESDIDNVININAKLEQFTRTYADGTLTLAEGDKAIDIASGEYTFVFADTEKSYAELCEPMELGYHIVTGETRGVNNAQDIIEVYVEGGHATEIKTGSANDYLEVNSGLAEKVDLGTGKNIVVVNGGELKNFTSSGNDRLTVNGGSVENVSLGSGSIILNEGEVKGLLPTGGAKSITINGGSFSYKCDDESVDYDARKYTSTNTYYINGGTDHELNSGWIWAPDFEGVKFNEYYIDCSTFSGNVLIHRPFYTTEYWADPMGGFDPEILEISSRDIIYLKNANSTDFTRNWDPETKIYTLTNGSCTISYDNYMYSGADYYNDYTDVVVNVKLVFEDKTLTYDEMYTSVYATGTYETVLGTDRRDIIVVKGAEIGTLNLKTGYDKLTVSSGSIGTVESTGTLTAEITGGTIGSLEGQGTLTMSGGSIDTLTWSEKMTMTGGSIKKLTIVPPKDSYTTEAFTFTKGTIEQLNFSKTKITLETGMKVKEVNGSEAANILTNNSTSTMTAHMGAGNDIVATKGNNGAYYMEEGNDILVFSGVNSVGFGGAGADNITLDGTYNIGYGEDGNDTISLIGDRAAAIGGKGTDDYKVTWRSTDGLMLIDNSTAGVRDLDTVDITGLSFADCTRAWDAEANTLKITKGTSSLYLKGITATNLDYVKFKDGSKYYDSLISGATATSGLLQEISDALLGMEEAVVPTPPVTEIAEKIEILVYGK